MTAFFVNRGGMPDILMEKQKTAPQDGFFFKFKKNVLYGLGSGYR